jgi:hypothetical protein
MRRLFGGELTRYARKLSHRQRSPLPSASAHRCWAPNGAHEHNGASSSPRRLAYMHDIVSHEAGLHGCSCVWG